MSDVASQSPSGVAMALLDSRFRGVARTMANTLLRTGRSGVLNTARDFSCAILTADGSLLASAQSLPIHVLSGPDMMARAMVELHPKLADGDAFLHNSPYLGGSHAADHGILMPVMDDAGRHRFTVLAKAHQADVGNSQPTTYHTMARDVYEEGALIFPCVKVQSNGEINSDIVRMCEARIRVPEQWWGDFLATLGSARVGVADLKALAREVGWDRLEAFACDWFDYSERMMADAISRLPGGEVSAVSTHDPFPGTPEAGVPVRSVVSVDPVAARVRVDLTDNLDCLPNGLNLSEACARTAALIGVFNSVGSDVPKNAGSMRRVSVALREGCVVGIPKHPTSCSVATTNIAERVIAATQRAFAELADGIGMAEVGGQIVASAGVVSGTDERGEPFVNQIFLAIGSGAARPRADAWLTTGIAGCGGMCNLDSIELDELFYPIRVRERRLIIDSEGAGRHRGAPAIRVEFGPTNGSLTVAYGADGSVNAPAGARGGLSGGPSANAKRGRDGMVRVLPPLAFEELVAGETIISDCSGGGGYGDPRERPADQVARDVAEGWISAGRAASVYGVKLSSTGAVDESATARMRTAA